MVDPVEYDSYFVPSLFEPWSREVIKRAQVWKGDRVLDLACGTGIVACRIAGTGAKVTGLDSSADRLAQARVRATEESVPVTWVEGDATATRFPAGAFDLVTCQQGLQFFADRQQGCKEIRRLLASGGRAVIACWAGLATNPVYQLMDAIGAKHFGAGYLHAYDLDEPQLRTLLAGAKFMAIQIETVTRTVRFPEPERYVRNAMDVIASARNADTVNMPAAIEEGIAAVQPFIVDGQIEMKTCSLIGIGRVSAKT